MTRPSTLLGCRSAVFFWGVPVGRSGRVSRQQPADQRPRSIPATLAHGHRSITTTSRRRRGITASSVPRTSKSGYRVRSWRACSDCEACRPRRFCWRDSKRICVPPARTASSPLAHPSRQPIGLESYGYELLQPDVVLHYPFLTAHHDGCRNDPAAHCRARCTSVEKNAATFMQDGCRAERVKAMLRPMPRRSRSCALLPAARCADRVWRCESGMDSRYMNACGQPLRLKILRNARKRRGDRLRILLDDRSHAGGGLSKVAPAC